MTETGTDISVIHTNTLSLLSGRIALGLPLDSHLIATLPELGISHVVMLREREEDALQYRGQAEAAGLTWAWMPLGEGQGPAAGDLDSSYLEQYLAELKQLLVEGRSLYFQCDASLERCTILLYALCHYCRMPSSSAYPLLHSLPALSVHTVPRASLHWAAKIGAGAP